MTTSSLKTRILDDIKAAMKAQEKVRLATLRLLTAAIKQVEVDKRIELSDADILALLDKMIKQRRESIKQFEQANRQDLIDKETAELDILQTYLPQAMSEAEVSTLIQQAIAELHAQSMQDMGKVMAIVKPKVQGRADMNQVSVLVKSLLNQ